jgi:UDP-hydrolysing UDP-N-acetyl-D-glucosamine 2-epimerase
VTNEVQKRRIRVLGVTGSRAEFGLLEPVFRAIQARAELELVVVAAGAHLLRPAHTIDDVVRAFPVAARVAMQIEGRAGRAADAAAFARGAEGFARTIDALRPEWVLVLGDRIEAFAAASAAALGGTRVAHLHGGDRAEGVADESMRHAISKLAHLHGAASKASAERLLRMGEDADRVHVVGSPAIDGLAEIAGRDGLDDASFADLGRPELVVVLHPTGRPDDEEREIASNLLSACVARGRVLVLDPNSDPGRDGIVRAIESFGDRVRRIAHLPRSRWIGLLRRARVLAGNSSAGLIEAAALGVRVLDVGSRQAGRERAANVVSCPETDLASVTAALEQAWSMSAPDGRHPYGDGRASERIADLLASPRANRLTLTKRNAY